MTQGGGGRLRFLSVSAGEAIMPPLIVKDLSRHKHFLSGWLPYREGAGYHAQFSSFPAIAYTYFMKLSFFHG